MWSKWYALTFWFYFVSNCIILVFCIKNEINNKTVLPNNKTWGTIIRRGKGKFYWSILQGFTSHTSAHFSYSINTVLTVLIAAQNYLQHLCENVEMKLSVLFCVALMSSLYNVKATDYNLIFWECFHPLLVVSTAPVVLCWAVRRRLCTIIPLLSKGLFLQSGCAVITTLRVQCLTTLN